MKKTSAILAAVLFTASVFLTDQSDAQAPQKMNYQSVIRNSSNVLVISTAIGMKISILQNSANGAAVYVETQKPTTNANGLATIEIGSGTVVFGIFSGIDWSAGPYYLKVQTDPGGGTNYTITGTSQLLSVPYALYSASGGTLTGVTASPPLSSSGGTAPDISLSGKVPVANLPSLAGDATGTIDAVTVVKLQNRTLAPTAPTNGQVLAYNLGNSQWEPQSLSNSGNSGGWSLTGSNIYYNSGNVGIGTSNPKKSLDIVSPQHALSMTADGPDITFYDSPRGSARNVIQSVGGDLNFFTESYMSGTNTSALLKLANNGNVGIGTPSPAAKLDVEAISSNGVYSTTNSGAYAVWGNNPNGGGVYGSSASGFGVYGSSTSASGMEGHSTDGFGVYGISASNDGVHGESASLTGVAGVSTSGFGVYGISASADGVQGHSTSSSGVAGVSTSGFGVYGNSASADGVQGRSTSSSGVAGISTGGYGVFGESSGAGLSGVYGITHSSSGAGVIGETYVASIYTLPIGAGVTGIAHVGGYGIHGIAVDGANVAGYFDGLVYISTDLSVSGSKHFKIDHPLDPANKYLLHASIESPDVKNLYDGNVTTDVNGEAIVTLPTYFEALNKDFRYQLTVLGQFAQAIVSSKIKNNQFTVKTDKPNVEVSWQVTGIRQDAYMKAHPMVVEQDKPANERGTYQHPELFGQTEEKSLSWSQNPELWKRLKKERDEQAPLLKP